MHKKYNKTHKFKGKSCTLKLMALANQLLITSFNIMMKH